MKILIIEKCNHCRYFESNMYGERCFHPKVTKPHPEEDWLNIKIPEWCPLEDK